MINKYRYLKFLLIYLLAFSITTNASKLTTNVSIRVGNRSFIKTEFKIRTKKKVIILDRIVQEIRVFKDILIFNHFFQLIT